jgi:hypothetical protein
MVRGQIESILDRDERPAGCLYALDRSEAMDQRAPEPIQLGHHQPVARARLDPRQSLLEQRAVRTGPGGIELLKDMADPALHASWPRP